MKVVYEFSAYNIYDGAIDGSHHLTREGAAAARRRCIESHGHWGFGEPKDDKDQSWEYDAYRADVTACEVLP